MNANLKELAKEAGVWRQHYDIGEESFANLEEFAKLIINRVISVYNDTETFRTSTFDDNRVLEYFGVKK